MFEINPGGVAFIVIVLLLAWGAIRLIRPKPIELPPDDDQTPAEPSPRRHTPAPAAQTQHAPTPAPTAAPAGQANGIARGAAPRVGLAPPPAGVRAPDGSIVLELLIAAQPRHMQRVQRHDFTKGPLLLFFKWRAALGANAIAVPFCFMPDHTGENRRKAIEWLDLITQTSRVLVDVLEFNPKDREMVDRWRDFLDWMFKAGDDLKRWIHPAVNPFLYLWILRDLLRLGISDATMALVGHDTAAFDGNADLLGILEMPGARPTATAQYAALAPTVESAEVIAATPPADSDLPVPAAAPRTTAELRILDPTRPADE